MSFLLTLGVRTLFIVCLITVGVQSLWPASVLFQSPFLFTVVTLAPHSAHLFFIYLCLATLSRLILLPQSRI